MTEDTEISISSYIQALQKELATGNTTEHTHRPALKTLIESNVLGVIATYEPGRIKCVNTMPSKLTALSPKFNFVGKYPLCPIMFATI